MTVVHGRTVALRDVDVTLRRRPGHRADGPQRLRASRRCCGRCRAPAAGAPGRSGSARLDPARLDPRGRAAAWSGWCRRPPPTCSTSRPSPRSAPRPTAAPAACRELLDRLVPGHPRRPAPPRPLRGAAAGAGARAGAGRPAAGAAARRADPRPRLRRQARCSPGSCATSPTTATRCWSPPTTWSSSPRPPTRSSCSPRARWSRRGRYAGWSPSRRRSRRRSPRCSAPPLAARRRGRRGAGRVDEPRRAPGRRVGRPASRSAAVGRGAGVASLGRADDAGLAAAGAGARRTPGSTRRSCSWRCCRS